MVLVSSFPYTINWSQEHVPAILHMAHSSQDEGWALAQVLFGDYNPGGHTIVTWPASMDQLPPMLDYDIRHGRTYMYFKGEPLYPFGHGLSYTTFRFANLRTDKSSLAPDGQVVVSLDVTNTGKIAGDAVPQLYVRHLGSKVERPALKLAGFGRVRLEPGQTKTVQIPVKASQLAYWDTGRKAVRGRAGVDPVDGGFLLGRHRRCARTFRLLEAPYPELDDLLRSIGEAGRHVADIEASEGAAAGTSTVCLRWAIEPRTRFPVIEELELPQPVPALAGASLLVTGSGRRLREESSTTPQRTLRAFSWTREGGQEGCTRPTIAGSSASRASSNSHLAVRRGPDLRHWHELPCGDPRPADPSDLPEPRSALSGRDSTSTHVLLRWQPETIVNLPEGIGFVPFLVPGSSELMAATIESLRRHRIVVMRRNTASWLGPTSGWTRAADRVEYAETAAKDQVPQSLGRRGWRGFER